MGANGIGLRHAEYWVRLDRRFFLRKILSYQNNMVIS